MSISAKWIRWARAGISQGEHTRAISAQSAESPPAPNSADIADIADAIFPPILPLRETITWRPIGFAIHPASGEEGRLVLNPSGRLALDVGRYMLTVDQEWAWEQARRWRQ